MCKGRGSQKQLEAILRAIGSSSCADNDPFPGMGRDRSFYVSLVQIFCARPMAGVAVETSRCGCARGCENLSGGTIGPLERRRLAVMQCRKMTPTADSGDNATDFRDSLE